MRHRFRKIKADFLIYTRVVYRSNNNANALGGVSYANANNDSSHTNANIGVRLAKHADCKNLFYKLTGKKMKNLKDLSYKYKPKDGRKRFTGARIKSPELINKDVIVLDYEKDVQTKNGNRTVIKLELDGKERKYFTSLEETLFLCESAERDGEIPFKAHCEGEISEKGLIIIHFT